MSDLREQIAELRKLPPEVVWERLAQTPETEAEALLFDWNLWGRDKQLRPAGDWTYWLILAGRGFGKTRTGAETVRQWHAEGYQYVNLIGATADDARDIMIEGESGILACSPPSYKPVYKRAERRLVWPNGAVSLIFTADEPERLRGKQHEKLWADELAAWRYPESWDQAKFGLRLGKNPQAIITTTPRPVKVIKDLMADPATAVTRGSTEENRENLAPAFFDAVISKYEGTRIGRQELYAELLEDNPNALFRREDIDAHRVHAAPEDRIRCAVAIDPAVTANENSDETGIIAGCSARVGGKLHFYILTDASQTRASPERWASEAVKRYAAVEGDAIVAEVNNGGDLVESVIRNVDPNVRVIKVRASRGKITRAEPIAALYEQGRVHHVGMFSALEDQICDYDPATAKRSPDRMDALVWLVSYLMSTVKNQGFADFVAAELQKAGLAQEAEPVEATELTGWQQIAQGAKR